MAERRAVTREMVGRYRRANKPGKSAVLDELCALTGWTRDHARRAIRLVAAAPRQAKKSQPVARQRLPTYDEETIKVVAKCWAVLDAACGKRLAPVLPGLVAALEAHGELAVTDDQRVALGKISAATIDRRLAKAKASMVLKGRSGTKPGGLLKHQIPVRTFADWNEDQPGFTEIDLVGHEGGNSRGEFAQALTVTDVCSGWTENQAVKNKAQRWVFEAIKQVRADLPFALLGIDSDNGSEFINDQMLRYCETEKITFTRGRPSRKNDNCYVEQKNWAVVRRAVGYLRYDTDEEVDVLNQLYRRLRLITNYFGPQAKLVSKTREGAKVSKRYDTPKSPYQRLIDDPRVPADTKARLTAKYLATNPAKLRREIIGLQQHLVDIGKTKTINASKEVRPPTASGQSR